MYPSFIATLKAAPSVTGIFGSNPLRVALVGALGQKPTLPYAAHQLVSGSVENYLGTRADMDSYRVQFSVYAATAEGAFAGAFAIRDALESSAYVVSLNGAGRDPDTDNFYYAFDMEFMSSR